MSMRKIGKFLTLLLIPCLASAADDNYAEQRENMIRSIEKTARATSLELDKEALDTRVLEAMRTVPRHALIPPEHRSSAYRNRPVPIGYGQTISQPYIVAIMTDLLNPEPTHKVLEVGTGSGYQAAILSRLVSEVYSIEIVEALGERAMKDLAELGYDKPFLLRYGLYLKEMMTLDFGYSDATGERVTRILGRTIPISLALTAAETGHLVFGTLHTSSGWTSSS